MAYEKAKLGEVAKIVTGNTPSKKNNKYWESGDIPFITPAELRSNKVQPISKSKNYITEKVLEKARILPKDTVMVCCIGSLGKIGIADRELVTNQQINSLIFDEDLIYYKYGAYYLSTISPIMEHLAPSTTVKIINKTLFSNMEIPLPSLETQKKIAEVLDNAGELIDKRKEQIEKLDDFIESVFLNMFGDPVVNSHGFLKARLEDLGKWQSGGTPSRRNQDYFKGDIPWLSSGELERIYVEDSKEKITEEAIENSSAKKIQPGCLLLGMYDTAALKSSINKVTCSCNQAIAYAKINSKMANTVYVYYAIQIGKDYYRRLQRGVRQKNLNLSMVKNIKIPIPPIHLQNQFAQMVEEVEKQKEKMEESLIEMENLFNSLMQRAFKGELF